MARGVPRGALLDAGRRVDGNSALHGPGAVARRAGLAGFGRLRHGDRPLRAGLWADALRRPLAHRARRGDPRRRLPAHRGGGAERRRSLRVDRRAMPADLARGALRLRRGAPLGPRDPDAPGPQPADPDGQPLSRPAGVPGRAPLALLRPERRDPGGRRASAGRLVRPRRRRLGRRQVFAVPRRRGALDPRRGDRARADLVERGDDAGAQAAPGAGLGARRLPRRRRGDHPRDDPRVGGDL